MNPTKTLSRVGENQKCEQKIFRKGKYFFHQPPTHLMVIGPPSPQFSFFWKPKKKLYL